MKPGIKLEVKSFGSSDVELETWSPEHPAEVFFVLEVEIGEAGDERSDLFYVTVATPEGLRLNHEVPVTKAGPLVVPEFSLSDLRQRVEEIVADCAAGTWTESVERLQKHFDYEFADYSLVAK